MSPRICTYSFSLNMMVFFLIVWDVKMSDLLSEKVSLAHFRGVAFVGGFSYADVMDSAKGYAPVIRKPTNSPHIQTPSAHATHNTLK